MWMTNRGRLHRFVEQELLPAWGMTCVATWWWLKCGSDGQPTTPLSSQHRHPYESLVLLRRSGESQHWHYNCIRQHESRADEHAETPAAMAAASLPTAVAVGENGTGAKVRDSLSETAASCATAAGAGRSRGQSPREPCGGTAREVFRDGVVLFSLRDPAHSRKPQVGKLLWHLMQMSSRVAAEAPPNPGGTTASHCELQAIPGAETPIPAPDARHSLQALGTGQPHPVSASPDACSAKGLRTSGTPPPLTSPGSSTENDQTGCNVPGGAKQHQREPASARGGLHCQDGSPKREIATKVAEGVGSSKCTQGSAELLKRSLPLRASVEQLPCLELFAREMQSGWTSWGNEVLRFQDAHQFGVHEAPLTHLDALCTAPAALAAAGKLL